MAAKIRTAEDEANATATLDALKRLARQERTDRKYHPGRHNAGTLQQLNRKIRSLEKALAAYRQPNIGSAA